MTLRETQSESPPFSRTTASLSVLSPQRGRLAIISTRNKLCGIAAYTQALERQLADVFDITVFDLDQYLLRSRHPRVRALGDRHIRQICRELAGFDAVNLQLEHGTLGRAAADILRRFRWLVAAAPRLSITFHTFKRPPIFPTLAFTKKVATLKWYAAAEMKLAFSRELKLSTGVAKIISNAQRQKPVSVIVHNRRDLSDARHLYGFERVSDHPLTFLSSAEAEDVLNQATRRRFPQLDPLPEDAILVGVFGFLNDYKGFGTAIRSLHHLSPHHHLLIFGGLHPNETRADTPMHPYISSLLRDANVDVTLYDQMQNSMRTGLSINVESRLADLFGRHPRDLSNRVHFMGAPDDADFLAGMATCDVVVLPYLEVGQSSSGPISQAIELGRRVIASRTHAFLEFARYHPGTIEFFDIGNHLELAERITARPQHAARREGPLYTVETNKAIYLAANNAPARDAVRFARRYPDKLGDRRGAAS